MTAPLFPIALKLEGLLALVVGGGTVAAAKTRSLLEAGAKVRDVAPEFGVALFHPNLTRRIRGFEPEDLDDCWLAISAATPEVNRAVSAAARARRIFVVAVDDPKNATAYGTAVTRRGGVTFGISTDGSAPALSGLLREALEEVLPDDLGDWADLARELREDWRRRNVPMAERRPLLLRALNARYGS